MSVWVVCLDREMGNMGMVPGEMRRRRMKLNGFNWIPATIFEMLLLAIAHDNYLDGSSIVGGGRC